MINKLTIAFRKLIHYMIKHMFDAKEDTTEAKRDAIDMYSIELTG